MVTLLTRRSHKRLEGETKFMNYVLLIVALIGTAGAPCRAQQPAPHKAEFDAFYANFLAAVRANKKEKLADLIAFPVEDWSVERKGDVQSSKVKDRADFLARYDTLFTTFMRSHIPRAKLEGLADGRYLLTWHNAGAEFSFEFVYITGTGYRVSSYTIGPQ
jgi:hypothetical protein